MNDDVPLIEATLSGESAAFGQLVCKYQDRLYNTVFHVTGNAEDARDVVQDAFVQAFVRLETFRRSSAFFTWLYRIAFNTAISQQRRKRPTVSIDAIHEMTGREAVDRGEGPSDRMEREESVGQVRGAIAQLGDEYRDVLVLREIEGCCYETIAEILEVPVGTVRSRLHRARLQLRERLSGMLEEEVASDKGKESGD